MGSAHADGAYIINMKILIQKVIVEWTKKSRGAPLANKRNLIPEIFQIPIESVMLKDNQYIKYELVFDERDDFLKKEKYNIEVIKELIVEENIRIYKKENRIGISYCHVPSISGGPERKHNCSEKQLFELQVGHWRMVRYNGRYADWDTGEWSYHKAVFNIACACETHKDIFLKVNLIILMKIWRGCCDCLYVAR